VSSIALATEEVFFVFKKCIEGWFFMNRTSIIANVLLAISFFNFLHISGMEEQIILSPLPYDLLTPIIYAQKSLKDTIKTTLLLRKTCTYFNTKIVPAEIGKFCKNYDITEKNRVMKKLLSDMSNTTYWNKRRAVIILVHAGADNTIDKFYPLLWRAVNQKDKEMLTALFENGANPNQRNCYSNEPHWFHITDVDIVKLFIRYGLDVHEKGINYTNILWHAISHGYSSELIDLYLQNEVNVKKVYDNGSTIFHHFVGCSINCAHLDDYIKIGSLLLKAAPKMINKSNDDGQTPLWLAYKKLQSSFGVNDNKKNLEAVIHLFKSHSGKKVRNNSK
jgi:ankyrin repeat protein